MVPATVYRYGDDPAQVVEFFAPPAGSPADPPAGPPGGPGTAVVIVHGGFWRAVWDREHARPQAAAMAEAGLPTVLIEYRRASLTGAGWPAPLTDVIAAIRCAATVPAISRAKLVAVGHSAGGHLLALAATDPGLVADARLTAAITLGGILDLALTHELHLGSDAADAVLGGGPSDRPQRWTEADPMTRAPVLPVVAIHGTLDEEVPVELSRAYARRWPEHTRLIELPGTGHYEPITPGSAAFERVIEQIRQEGRTDG